MRIMIGLSLLAAVAAAAVLGTSVANAGDEPATRPADQQQLTEAQNQQLGRLWLDLRGARGRAHLESEEVKALDAELKTLSTQARKVIDEDPDVIALTKAKWDLWDKLQKLERNNEAAKAVREKFAALPPTPENTHARFVAEREAYQADPQWVETHGAWRACEASLEAATAANEEYQALVTSIKERHQALFEAEDHFPPVRALLDEIATLPPPFNIRIALRYGHVEGDWNPRPTPASRPAVQDPKPVVP
jgi:hypothetical protein